MFFGTKMDFNGKFPEDFNISGFDVSPVKEIKKNGVVVETVRCPPEEAKGYALCAVDPTGSLEYIADFKDKGNADLMAKLLMSILSTRQGRTVDRISLRP